MKKKVARFTMKVLLPRALYNRIVPLASLEGLLPDTWIRQILLDTVEQLEKIAEENKDARWKKASEDE